MKVPEIYRESGQYSSEDMFSPPAERRPHVIRFELTEGCPWGKCTYCCGFDGTPFQEKTLTGYKKHVDRVFDWLAKDVITIKRIFIGGGDALAVATPKLVETVRYTRESYTDAWTRVYPGWVSIPRRIAIYGSTRSINSKEVEELEAVRQAGVKLIYWGVESGSEGVLDYVNKGCTEADILNAADKVNKAGLDTSVMIMPGLGGFKYYGEHIKTTATALEAIRPQFITFMGINANPRSAYARRMEREQLEGTNRPLTEAETVWQMTEIIRQTNRYQPGANVGCFDSHIDAVGCNPFPFGQARIYPSLNLGGSYVLVSDQEQLARMIQADYRQLY